MAQTPVPKLRFAPGCSDCGLRTAELPEPLPEVADDFDWAVRDYDGFRLFMLEELAARFPERRRWTPADMEVVMVEAMSVVLDQLSDRLDRTFAEAFLESARQPQSVRRLLALIGYDAVAEADARAQIPDPVPPLVETPAQGRERLQHFHSGLSLLLGDYPEIMAQLTPAQRDRVQAFLADPAGADVQVLAAVQLLLEKAPELVGRIQQQALYRHWTLYPQAMLDAKHAGPAAVHTQRRMVTEEDYARRLEDHPLVLFSHAFSSWTGSWQTIVAACFLFGAVSLDTPLDPAALGSAPTLLTLRQAIDDFHRRNRLREVDWSAPPVPRTILHIYLHAYRMSGREVVLRDAEKVGIQISLSLRLADHYFQSEIRRAVEYSLGNKPGGFFAPGNLRFGQDLFASDLIEVVMALAGIEAVCLNRFKRVGKNFADQADSGRIELQGYEVAVCDNLANRPALGNLRLVLHGGQKG
jgi:hypothetical protein